MANEERVASVFITDNKDGKKYELDFSRDSVRFAEARGFKTDDVLEFPVTKFPELFFYAFRMHHKNLSRQQTDALYEKLGGFSEKLLERILLLYQQAQTANNFIDEEELGKNGNLTVEM